MTLFIFLALWGFYLVPAQAATELSPSIPATQEELDAMPRPEPVPLPSSLAKAGPEAIGPATFTPGDVYAWTVNSNGVFNITAGGNFTGVPPFATTPVASTGVYGQITWKADLTVMYLSDTLNNRVLAVTPAGVVSVFATGVQAPTGLVWTPTGKLLVAEVFLNTVKDITAGGDFTGAPNFATNVGNYPRNMLVSPTGQVLVVSESTTAILDIAPGGVMSTANRVARTPINHYALAVDANARVLAGSGNGAGDGLYDITAGGTQTVPTHGTGAIFGVARGPAAKVLVSGFPGYFVRDLTGGGAVASAPAFATGLPGTAVYSALATVPPFPPPPPTVTTVAASGVGLGVAVLNGLVRGNGLATTYGFEWGVSPGLDQVTAVQVLGDVNTTQPVSAVLNGLALDTTYAFRVRAVNAGGVAEGATLTFATPPLTVDGNGRYTLLAGKTWTLGRDEILPGDLRVEGTLVTGGFRLTVLGTVSVVPGGGITPPANVLAFFRDGVGAGAVDTSLGRLETLQTLGLVGAQPMARLLEGGDGWLYGTTASGGTAGKGTVFRTTRGGQVELLGNFTGPNGANPQSALVGSVQLGIFGTTTTGGAANKGVIFRVLPQGGIIVVASFDGVNGAASKGGLTLGTDGILYGTASEGGALGVGTIFRVQQDGTIEKLADFSGPNGSRPQAPLFQASDGAFYGTATYGGANRVGVIFRFTPSPAEQPPTLAGDKVANVGPPGGIEVLWNFDGAATGSYPLGPVIEGAPGAFLGTCYSGGANGVGTVFRFGTGSEQPPAFGSVAVQATSFATSVGEGPIGPLALGLDGCFYGTAYSGVGNYGAVFKVTDGGTLTRVASVLGNAGMIVGARPGGGLLLGADGAFYGVSENGGNAGNGAVFRLLLSGVMENVVHFGGIPLPSTLAVGPTNGQLYGTTQRGGEIGYGSVFALAPRAKLATLASFRPGYGQEPSPGAGVTFAADGTLFGTTTVGGLGYGVIWKLPSGGALAAPVSFNGANGRTPHGGLVPSGDGNFFGTTSLAGGFGNVFKVSPTGALTPQGTFAGTDGSSPLAALVSDGAGAFYGTTRLGGAANRGAIYKLTPGSGLALVASFTGANGAEPNAALVRTPVGDFYGTTAGGGANNGGTVFKLTAAGALTTWHHFAGPDGRAPRGPLWPTGDGGFFGTTSQGGAQGKGTVFRLGALGPPETIAAFAGDNAGGTPTTGLVAAGDGYLYGTTDTTAYRIPTGPSVTTLPAANFTPTQTTLRGEVQARGLASTATFEWGTTPALGQTLAAGTTASSNAVPVQATLPLASNTTYYYRVSLTNVMSTRRGAILSFKTPNLIANGSGHYTLGAGSVWTLAGDTTLTGNLTVLGTLDTAGYTLTVPGKLIVNFPAVLLNTTGVIAYLDRDGALPPGTTALLGDAAHDLLDIDGDGLNSLMEFVLGTNPSAFTANALPIPAMIGGHLTLTYKTPAGISGVQALVEASTDLVNYASGPGYTAVTSDTSAAGVRTVTVRSDLPTTPQYLRLRATR